MLLWVEPDSLFEKLCVCNTWKVACFHKNYCRYIKKMKNNFKLSKNILRQAWTWLLEQTVHCWNHHDKSTAMFIHDRICCQGMMKWQVWTMMLQQPWTLVVVSSQVFHVLTNVKNPCRFAKLYIICWNIIEQYCYFTNPVNSAVIRLLSQQPCNTL